MFFWHIYHLPVYCINIESFVSKGQYIINQITYHFFTHLKVQPQHLIHLELRKDFFLFAILALIQVSRISFESEVYKLEWRHLFNKIMNK